MFWRVICVIPACDLCMSLPACFRKCLLDHFIADSYLLKSVNIKLYGLTGNMHYIVVCYYCIYSIVSQNNRVMYCIMLCIYGLFASPSQRSVLW